MIAFVRGAVVERRPGVAVIDVGGVGFAVLAPDSTLNTLPAPPAVVTLRTWLYVREDAMQLFGFATEGERALFERLLTVSGVGPKVALAILSALPVVVVLAALAQSNAKVLTAASGVGKRLAERIVVELRDRVNAIDAGVPDVASRGASGLPVREDAVSALLALGVTRADAIDLVATALRDIPADSTLEEILRRSLAALPTR